MGKDLNPNGAHGSSPTHPPLHPWIFSKDEKFKRHARKQNIEFDVAEILSSQTEGQWVTKTVIGFLLGCLGVP
jgi:hypothetical protein